MAGEIGHVIVQPGGPKCVCGLNGCLEAMAAGPAILREARAKLESQGAPDSDSLLAGSAPLTTAKVYQAAHDGDTLALAVTRQTGRWLAQAVYNLVMTCDVERVVFGGGVARAGAGLIGLMPLGYEAALWGALALTETGLAQRDI